MNVRLLYVAAVASPLVIAAACGRSAVPASDPAIRLTNPQDGGTAYVEVIGLSDEALDALEDAGYTAVPSTVVARVYPTGDVVPENLLRMCVHFSGPMGARAASRT